MTLDIIPNMFTLDFVDGIREQIEYFECESGHSATRKMGPGRKTNLCSAHRPTVETSTDKVNKVMDVTIPALPGHVIISCGKGHQWVREIKRGRTPEFCPFHIVVKVPAASTGEMKNLYCQKGEHMWKRAPQKGATPNNCPEHGGKASSIEAPKMVEAPVSVTATDVEAMLKDISTENVEHVIVESKPVCTETVSKRSGKARGEALAEKMNALAKKTKVTAAK